MLKRQQINKEKLREWYEKVFGGLRWYKLAITTIIQE